MRRKKALGPIEAAFLARIQERFKSHDPGARMDMARALGMSAASISTIVKGDQVPEINKWPDIATYLDFRIDDLFVNDTNKALNKVPSMNSPVTGDGLHSPAHGRIDGTTALALQAENTRLHDQIDQLTIQIDIVQHATAALADLARNAHAHGRAARTGKRKSRAR
jgi:DNA-binding XRE family transcriptional regulator